MNLEYYVVCSMGFGDKTITLPTEHLDARMHDFDSNPLALR